MKCIGLACAFALVVVVVIIVLGTATAVRSRRRTQNTKGLVGRKSEATPALCTTDACNVYAGLLQRSLNHTVDPCTNFLEYVCTGRHMTFSIRQQVFREFQAYVTDGLRTIRPPASGQTAQQKAARFYQTCRDVLYNGNKPLTELRDILEKEGVQWPHKSPKPDLISSVFSLGTRWYWSPLVDVSAVSVAEASALNIMPSAAYMQILRKRSDLVANGQYPRHFHVLQKSYARNDQDVVTFGEMKAIEDNIISLLKDTLNTTAGTHNAIWQENDMRVLISAKLTIRIKEAAVQYLNFSRQKPIEATVRNTNFIVRFMNLTSRAEDKVHLYFGWCAVQYIMPFSSSDLVTAMYCGNREAAEFLHTSFCYNLTRQYFGYALYGSYAQKVATPDVLADVSGMTRNILSVYHDVSSHSKQVAGSSSKIIVDGHVPFKFIDRCNDDYLRETFANFSDMTESPSHNWRRVHDTLKVSRETDIRIPPSVWDGTAQFYVKDAVNSFSLMPYALSMPLYENSLPMAIRYGALGSILSGGVWELLSHSSSMRDLDKIACLRTISASRLHEDKGASLVNEIVSLKAAFAAFAKAADVKKTSLHHLRNFSGSQLFFLSYCYMSCGTDDQDAAYLCKGAPQYLPSFRSAFNCSLDAQLLAVDSCEEPLH